MNIGDLVVLNPDRERSPYLTDTEFLGVGIVIAEYMNFEGDLFFEVFWSFGIREYIRPSYLKIINRSKKK